MVKAVDRFLFSIFVLGCFSDQRGKLWRRNHAHLYMVEMTEPVKRKAYCESHGLLQFLPTSFWYAPTTNEGTVREDCLDQKKWQGESYQIVYYYLKNYDRMTGRLSDSLEMFNAAQPVKHNTNFLECIFR